MIVREHIADDQESDIQAHLVAAHIAGRLPEIGIVPEVDIFRSDPYLVARSLASLDILSNGRAGFAPLAEPRGSFEIGYAKVGADAAFVGEFIAAVGSLWNNWRPGALARDWAENRYVNSRLIRRADHEGKYFSIRGPLPTPTAIQPAPFFIAQDHPAHKRIVGRASAVITSSENDTNDHRHSLIEKPLRNVSRDDRRFGVLLRVGEDVTSWSELQDLSAVAASTLDWSPVSSGNNFTAKFAPHPAAKIAGAAHV
nr:LLM class flavin-dependent oxidoreductase [Agrobacterium sp. AGB01]